MKNYILIDGSYFVFYRVFALQIWWKNAKRDEELTNPFLNTEFREKYIDTFLSKIEEIKINRRYRYCGEGLSPITNMEKVDLPRI